MCHHVLFFHVDHSILLGFSSSGRRCCALDLKPGYSPLLGQAETGLPMAALAEIEEAADDSVHLL